ncbi:MAG: tetratricopeptide repeat protein [Polymorphobacter sp.]|uniref:tetratricopeptide repeat protein n=1 Tax=Polymorphobacter sp. TaxID=1909290 RepID=UPI003A8716D2
MSSARRVMLPMVLAAFLTSPALWAGQEDAGTPMTPLALIDGAIADGRLDAAEEIIRRAPLEVRDPELRLRQAEIALARGRMAEALTGFGLLIDEPAVAARAHQGLGISRLRRDQIDEAKEALDTALALDPGLLRAQRARAAVADRERDWKRADAAYAAALALAPGDAETLSNRGWSRMLRGEHAAAEADLMAALSADPALEVAAGNLRLARAMQGKYQQAFEGSTRETLAADLNTVGFAAMSRGDLDIAEAYFRRAMMINPVYDRTAAANLSWVEAERARLATAGAPKK